MNGSDVDSQEAEESPVVSDAVAGVDEHHHLLAAEIGQLTVQHKKPSLAWNEHKHCNQ